MAKERRPDRPREECDPEGRHRGQGGSRRIGRREEEAREDQHCRRGVDVEVEKFDGRANQARKQHLPRTINCLRSRAVRPAQRSLVYPTLHARFSRPEHNDFDIFEDSATTYPTSASCINA